MFSRRTADLTALLLLALPTVAGLALWASLPAEMAIHFGASGRPDNFVGRPFGILGAPAIGLAAVAFVRLSKRVDPTADRLTLDISVVFLGFTVGYAQSFVLAWNLGYRVSPLVVVVPVLVGAVLVSGYAMRRDGLFG